MTPTAQLVCFLGCVRAVVCCGHQMRRLDPYIIVYESSVRGSRIDISVEE